MVSPHEERGIFDGRRRVPAEYKAEKMIPGSTLSIIIPAYNESARIGPALEQVLACIHERDWPAEVIVVNDGSRDDTAAIVRNAMARDPLVRLIENATNRGKGYSVRNGMLHATGDVMMFTDADLSSPIEETERLLAAIQDGADIAIGSRWLDRGRQTKHQPWYRQMFGRCFNGVTRLVMGLPFADTQCGFKAFRRTAAYTVFQLQQIERWGFDPELLFIALKRGFTVREVAVTWGHDERSRLSYLKDGLKMLEELVYIRWNAFTGVYSRNVSEFRPELPVAKG